MARAPVPSGANASGPRPIGSVGKLNPPGGMRSVCDGRRCRLRVLLMLAMRPLLTAFDTRTSLDPLCLP